MEPYLLEVWLEKKQIVFGDFLEVDVVGQLQGLWKNIKETLAVGNLPYYITSPIFRKLFTDGEACFLWGIFYDSGWGLTKDYFFCAKKNLIYGGYWTGHMKSST